MLAEGFDPMTEPKWPLWQSFLLMIVGGAVAWALAIGFVIIAIRIF